MGRIVGIDLGTTYSAVAIPEERRGPGFFVTPGCPGVSVILDARGRRITPSVVALGREGELLVGYDAKARAGASPAPIMHSKRSMGEQMSFPLGKYGDLRPEEVATHVLAYLKRMAEERLGEPVEEAVITVPAYFGLTAKQLTEEAGVRAGLRVAQVAPEPVAAALMYCASDPRPNLRILTYDLGGGTFDVAVLQKKDGVIDQSSIMSYDGDRFLGGYNFDARLAMWLAKHHGLELDPRAPADRVPLAKLMVLAEQAKLALSSAEQYEFLEQATGIADRHGVTMAIDLTLKRELFEELIRDEVERTIALCWRALNEKGTAPIAAASIDEILMVGGSSRIPLVARRLEEVFGRRPKLVEPDLCVALGAAILAGSRRTTRVGHLKLDPVPTETDLPTLVVTGAALTGPELPSVAGCVVTLRSADGGCNLRRTLAETGAFAFDGVALVEGELTELTLTVTAPDGREVARHRMGVRRTDRPRGGLIEQVQIKNSLAKPIGIVTKDGIAPVMRERTPLPDTKVIMAETTSTTHLRVPIVEESSLLGEIVMNDLPAGLAMGSDVEITLTVHENYQITGRARIPSVGREAKVTISLPKPVRKMHEELRGELEKARLAAEDALRAASAGAKLGEGRAARLKDQLASAHKMLASDLEEPARVEEVLDDVRRIIDELRRGWRPEPPRSGFDQAVRKARDMLGKAKQKQPIVAEEGYEGRIDALVREGDEAYVAQDGAKWKQTFRDVIMEHDKLKRIAEPPADDGGGGAADPKAMFLSMAARLEELRKQVKAEGRADSLREKFDSVAASLKAIDPKKGDAISRLVDWHNTEYAALSKEVFGEPDAGDDGLPRLPQPQRRG